MIANNRKNISPSIQKVQETLLSLGVEIKIVEFQDSTRTSAEAAARIGCHIGQIVKSLVFRGRVSGKPLLILTSGSNRVDEGPISQLFGETIIRAEAEFVRKSTGFAIGGVPPVGHLQPLKTYIDEDLLQYDKIWAAAGTPNSVFEIAPSTLVRVTGGRLVRVKT
jgi:prolyl-tRNA editing enzyme YbaK/EbsC (Cys-tRNA(Pro) deacylase)